MTFNIPVAQPQCKYGIHMCRARKAMGRQWPTHPSGHYMEEGCKSVRRHFVGKTFRIVYLSLSDISYHYLWACHYLRILFKILTRIFRCLCCFCKLSGNISTCEQGAVLSSALVTPFTTAAWSLGMKGLWLKVQTAAFLVQQELECRSISKPQNWEEKSKSRCTSSHLK